MKIKEIIFNLKPVNWIKGIFMVLIGILNTRYTIGIGRIAFNIFIGLPTYLLVSISIMLTVLILKISSESNENTLKNVRRIGLILGLIFFTSYGLSIYLVVILNLNYLSLLLVALIGAFLILSIYYMRTWEKKKQTIIIHIIESLSFSFGIIYGAVLNIIFIPMYIYLFFVATFLTQFSKAIITSYKYIAKDRKKDEFTFPITFGTQTAQRIALIFQIIIIISLIFPLFIGIYNPVIYFILMIPMIILFGITSLLTLRLDLGRRYRLMNLLFKIGIFFEILSLILASF